MDIKEQTLNNLFTLILPVLSLYKIPLLDNDTLTKMRESFDSKNFPPMKNDTILKVFKGEKIDHIPVWMMRQAGRTLPEFNAMRKTYSFFELCDNPFASSEVTLQPLQHYNIDAAIIFSDILIVPKVMGLNFTMEPGRGPVCLNPLSNPSDIDRLIVPPLTHESLIANYNAIFLTRLALNGSHTLYGFAGSAWTLMTYIVRDYKYESKAKEWINKYPEESKTLLSRLNEVILIHLLSQIKAGAQLVQIFDSSADLLSKTDYIEFSLHYSKILSQKIKEIYPNIPIILFPRGQHGALEEIFVNKDYNVFDGISLDHLVDIEQIKSLNEGRKVLQGNLDPGVILGDENVIKEKTKKMVELFGTEKYIANLGHGVWPEHKIENLQTFVDTVREVSEKLISENK